MLSSFPHLTDSEFIEACYHLRENFSRRGGRQNEWVSIEMADQYDIKYITITTALQSIEHPSSRASEDFEDDEVKEEEDDDDEALPIPKDPPIMTSYDIILSPSYRVPVLYISILDSQHRYPPTMATLYNHLIPSQYRAQAEAGGGIGGITTTDHPVTNNPVFFIHPCRTAEVMEASVGQRRVSAKEYLLMWIGAMGKGVGLNVPLALFERDEDE
ncbi:hypothetical protein BKA66DRAFT_510427 [Pyrenochaeta sp. MPI-SDFR-AT-0127]|nr:hypothetical protein BKA66DRAFT_510427 [Pyrenochaeta sp. MPI-SDFR-AT-0127]